MYRRRVAFVLGLAALTGSGAWAADFAKAGRALDSAVRAYAGFDRDQDGQPEIRTLARMKGCEAGGKGRGTVLVLVESRLVQKRAGMPELAPSIKTFVRDIAGDGENAFAVETSFNQGPEHQDGLTLIAYRDFLRRLWLTIDDFKGVILVGNYPQPFMVRQYAWHRDDPVTLFAGTKAEKSFKQPWVRAVAEPVVSPADIVLADMDGRWDRVYFKQPMNVTDLMAVFPKGSDVTEDWEYRMERYEDVFFVQDGPWKEEPLGGHKLRITLESEPNEECTPTDKKLPNPLALPEISISRINAYHAGVVPDSRVLGTDGRGLVDAKGLPQTVEFGDAKAVPGAMALWVHSEAFELKLLVEYFARNHAYRTGAFKDVLGPASISTGLGSGMGEMKAGVPGWKDLKTSAKADLDGNLSLTDCVEWLKAPALVRQVRVHSNPVLSAFERPKDVAALQAAIGPQAWYWTREGDKLVPSLKGIGGAMGFGLMRTLYENHSLPANPVLYFHTGCEAMRPIGAENVPFDSPDYAKWQLAECLLMYGNGLTVVGRGKVFYDEPREFWKVMGQGGTWGEAWIRYFMVESQDAALAKDGIGRKRSYFWSLLGDFTLRLPDSLTKPSGAKVASTGHNQAP